MDVMQVEKSANTHVVGPYPASRAVKGLCKDIHERDTTTKIEGNTSRTSQDIHSTAASWCRRKTHIGLHEPSKILSGGTSAFRTYATEERGHASTST
jgi:hypothetical protein